jgi:hypothetical protein
VRPPHWTGGLRPPVETAADANFAKEKGQEKGNEGELQRGPTPGRAYAASPGTILVLSDSGTGHLVLVPQRAELALAWLTGPANYQKIMRGSESQEVAKWI